MFSNLNNYMLFVLKRRFVARYYVKIKRHSNVNYVTLITKEKNV